MCANSPYLLLGNTYSSICTQNGQISSQCNIVKQQMHVQDILLFNNSVTVLQRGTQIMSPSLVKLTGKNSETFLSMESQNGFTIEFLVIN